MLVTKLGGSRPPIPPTSTGCCSTSEQLVLVFPEGRKGTEKPLRERYRLRRFGRGDYVRPAMRARAPIVPVAVLGAEEAQPVFAQLSLLRRLTRLPYVPVTPLAPAAGQVPDPVPGASATAGLGAPRGGHRGWCGRSARTSVR